MSAQGTAGGAVHAADRAGNSDGLENLARVGLIAYGVVHVLIAWLALQLAWGGGGQSADQSGAMATVADSPVGKPLLWIIAVGMIALAVWQAAEILRWRRGLSSSGDEKKKAVKKIVKSIAKAVVYVALAVLAIRFAVGSGQSSAQQQQQRTAGVFSWPAGRWLVAIGALILIGVGVHHIVRGVKKTFLKQIDLSEAPPKATRLITRLGQVGFPAKGVALILVGGLLGWAAITFDPAKATGLDGALHTILDAPFGAVLLTLVAVGIAAFGAFCFARARYPERT
jgi:succinate dehydrogenase/fumarate reductase cytochrome b subunit